MNMKIIAGIAIAISVLGGSIVLGTRAKNQSLASNSVSGKNRSSPITHTHEEVEGRYHHVLRNITKTDAHSLLRPVHFSIGAMFAASGTLVLNKQGKPAYIVTAAHLFSESQPGSDYYRYHVLAPVGFSASGDIERVVVDSLRHDDTPDGIQDIAICYTGKPALIPRVSKVRVSAQKGHAADYRVAKTPTVMVTSVATGERFAIVGELLSDHEVLFHVMLYECMNGESGSGYLGDNGRLYVMSGSVTIDKNMRDTIGIPDAFRYASTLTGITVNW